MHAWFTTGAWLNCKSEREENEVRTVELIAILIDEVPSKSFKEDENNTMMVIKVRACKK